MMGALLTPPPPACNLTAFSPDERRRYDTLCGQTTSAIREVVELPAGYRVALVRFTAAASRERERRDASLRRPVLAETTRRRLRWCR